MPLLEVQNLSKAYHGFPALHRVSFAVEAGELLGIIGPNGAGKTTLFDCIMGTLEVTEGRVRLRGEDITGRPEHVIARRGMRRAHQLTEGFPRLSVMDHMLVAAQECPAEGFVPTFLNTGRVQAQEAQNRGRARRLLELLRLSHMADTPGGSLSYGQRKLLALGMIMAAQPAVVLHNDFKLDNTMISDSGSIVAVFDWDMSTIGDPLVDLGTMLAYWSDTDSVSAFAAADSVMLGDVMGIDEITERYAARTGLDVSDASWYRGLALFRIAVICQQIYIRYVRGQTSDERFAVLGDLVPPMAAAALDVL